MEIANNSHYKNLMRYLSNPYFLFSLFSPKTLNPSVSLTPSNTIIHSNPLYKSYSLHFLSTGSHSNCSLTPPFGQSFDSFPIFKYNNPSYSYSVTCRGLIGPHCLFRCYSVSSSDGLPPRKSIETMVSDENSGFENMSEVVFDESKFRERNTDGVESDASSKHVLEIIELIRSGESDLGRKLNSMDLTLDVESITLIFRVLNCEKLSALHFFRWVRESYPRLYNSTNVCSLIIDNCGWLDDYVTMVSLLEEFRTQKICLSEKAFGFLPVFGSSKALIMESIRRLIDILTEIGGSCLNSGICALIKMLCTLESIDMAKFVIEITERKTMYYNILVRYKCKRGHIEEVHGLFKEMRAFGCDPDTKSYNYLLSSLCKNDRMVEACSVLEEMQEKGSPPNTLTFEIFIYFLCKLGKFDDATQFLVQMVSKGLEPRHTTHCAFIKGYFSAKEYELAYKYAVDVSVRHKRSSCVTYSLLASLHQKHGDLIVAQDILTEMMEKGFKPIFPVYRRISKRLWKTGRGCLAGDLKSRFSRFRLD